jgi:chaperone BCS1
MINKDTLSAVSHRSYEDRDDMTKKTMYILPIGISIIKYNNNNLNINIIQIGDPIEINGISKTPFRLTITTENNDNVDIIKDYLEHCKAIFLEEILEKRKTESKISCYIWDDYWEVFSKKHKRSIKSLCFADNKHINLLNEVKDFLTKSTEEEYLDYGIPYKYNILLEGYPGTGKSSLIHALASELDMNMATITFDPEMTDLKFMRAMKRIPEDTIISIEDLDVLFKKRKENEITSPLTFSGLLNTLDGPGSPHRQIIIMTTNYCCNLDSALKRPGRVDKTIHFDYSNKEQIQLIFNKFYKKEDKETIFNLFYKEIKYLKITTAILQGYLFRYRNDNILEHIKEIKETVEKNKYDAPADIYS